MATGFVSGQHRRVDEIDLADQPYVATVGDEGRDMHGNANRGTLGLQVAMKVCNSGPDVVSAMD